MTGSDYARLEGAVTGERLVEDLYVVLTRYEEPKQGTMKFNLKLHPGKPSPIPCLAPNDGEWYILPGEVPRRIGNVHKDDHALWRIDATAKSELSVVEERIRNRNRAWRLVHHGQRLIEGAIAETESEIFDITSEVNDYRERADDMREREQSMNDNELAESFGNCEDSDYLYSQASNSGDRLPFLRTKLFWLYTWRERMATQVRLAKSYTRVSDGRFERLIKPADLIEAETILEQHAKRNPAFSNSPDDVLKVWFESQLVQCGASEEDLITLRQRFKERLRRACDAPLPDLGDLALDIIRRKQRETRKTLEDRQSAIRKTP